MRTGDLRSHCEGCEARQGKQARKNDEMEDEEARNRKRIRGRAGRERIMYPRLQPGRGNRLWVGICVMRTLACPALRVVPLFFLVGLAAAGAGLRDENGGWAAAGSVVRGREFRWGTQGERCHFHIEL